MKYSLIIIFCLFLFNCKKKEIDALPPITQNGANTFGCLVNGSAWVSTGKPSSLSGKGMKTIEGGYQYDFKSDTIRRNVVLWATRNDGTTLIIFIRKVYKPGIYSFTQSNGTWPSSSVPLSYASFSDKSGLYITDVYHKGTLVITKADTINDTIAGTFAFEGYNYDTKQTISITNGRFDFLL